MGESKSFGQWLRHRRRELDLTQNELARHVGCAAITVRKIEADEMRPSKQLAELLVEQLGITGEEREDFVRFARGGEAVRPTTAIGPGDNLPHPVSSFVGRKREIADVHRLLGLSRLVTLTGAGGCGKSRLAIEATSQMLDRFADGVWFAEFAPIVDPTLVHATIASALRVREDPGRALIETLCGYLRSKQLLLIFDNCEHLIGECAQAADTLLQSCAQLRILATSREPLGIVGEEQYYVPCLSLPETAAGASAERLYESEAVRLFVDRAVLVQPSFALADTNLSPVVQICRRLDGMPLAIELAAARVKALSAQHIAERLDDRFNLLTDGNRTALPRHQTLLATIEWSHDLLPETTRALFRRLSVFAGGFSQEAVQAVCSGGGLAAESVLVELSRLVDRSLVEALPGGKHERCRMLETIRQFARERLKESGEEGTVRDRHLSFFTEWMEKAEPKLRGPEQIEWWDRIEIEHDNMRAALDWSLGSSAAQLGLRLAGTAFWFWKPRSYWREGLDWLKSSLARASTPRRTSGRAKALVAAGNLGLEPYAAEPVDAWLEESLGIWREVDDKWWISFTFLCMGWHRILMNDAGSSRPIFEESVAFAREAQDAWILGYALRGLGAALERVSFEMARPILEESLVHMRTAGDRWALGEVFKQLATCALGERDYARAASLMQESLELFRAIGDGENVAESLTVLAIAVLGQGDSRRAQELCHESLKLDQHQGYSMPSQLGATLIWLGCIAGSEGQPRRSAILLAAGESVLNSIGTTVAMWPWSLRGYREAMTSAQALLAEGELSEALSEGRAMTMEQAVRYALAETKEDEKQT